MIKGIKFLIRENSVTMSGRARILFLICFKRKQYKVHRGKSIEPKYWVQCSESIGRRKDDSTKINNYLS